MARLPINLRARRLLNLQPQENEATIRHHLCQLLEGLTEGSSEMMLEHPTPGGRSDIYLPRLRTIIEVKTHGGVDNPDAAPDGGESPFEQLQRYVLAEIERTRREENINNRRWTGILTDGTTWHIWSWEHRHNPAAQPEQVRYRTAQPAALVQRLTTLLEGELVGKPWIPEDPVDLFREFADRLRDIYDGITDQHQLATLETKRLLWLEMLQGSGMAPQTQTAQDRLFVAHTFLVSLARGVAHTVTNPRMHPEPQELLSDGFISWLLDTHEGRTLARNLLSCIAEYEWRQTRGDVLRPLYERFVSDSDRKDFGEFYTPDWLAAMLVRDVLDDDWCAQSIEAAQLGGEALQGTGVLDPACGSGTFLYHAALRLLKQPAMNDLSEVQQADVICQLVNGIDIHPVAAEFSRTTILRALPAPPSDGPSAVRIYQGDTMMLRDDENSLFRPQNGEIKIWTPQGTEISLPRSFTELPSFPDLLRRLVLSAANHQNLPGPVRNSVPDHADQQMIEDCHQKFGEIIEREGNSVWTWYITNITGPEQLKRRKIDRIVANPPWVKMAAIQVPERKRALEALAGKNPAQPQLNLWTGGIQAPHFDIAQLFVTRSRQLYLADPDRDPAAWVVKASALRAGNWEKFRQRHDNILAQSLDLSDVQVFGGGDARRSCILYDSRPSGLPQDAPVLKASCPDQRPGPASTSEEAAVLLRWHAEAQFPRAPSDYEPREWKNGATIFPYVLITVDHSRPAQRRGYLTVTTGRAKQPPWSGIEPLTGDVPDAWVAPFLRSERLLPFGLSPYIPECFIIPRGDDGRLLTEQEAAREPFWEELNSLYREYRGQGRSTPQTLLTRINHNGGLSVQFPLHESGRWLVVYPVSGDIMRACRIPEGTMSLQHTTFRRPTETAEEAAFLVAVLNAPNLKTAFLQSRASGRHFSKNPWNAVPVPLFNLDDESHTQLAVLAEQAEEIVRTMIAEDGDGWPQGQVAASNRIRERLGADGTAREIDILAARILPDHVH